MNYTKIYKKLNTPMFLGVVMFACGLAIALMDMLEKIKWADDAVVVLLIVFVLVNIWISVGAFREELKRENKESAEL